MMVLSLVFSVMALGTAMANDANAMVDRKPKNVYVSINVPPMGHCNGHDRPCPPPPPCHKYGNKHHKPHHNCCDHKPHHGKHGKPHGNHYSKPHGKPGGAPAGRPGGAPGGRPGGNHNGAPGRR